jgi:FG-GAP repeat
MRFSTALLLTGFAVLGCNPSDFNSLLDKAPVVEFSTTGNSTGSVVALPLPAPAEAGTTAAARMLLARSDSDYLAVAEYDKDGKVTLTKATDTERANLGGSAVMSMALASNGTVILGSPGFGGGQTPPGQAYLLNLTAKAGGGATFAIKPSIRGGDSLPRLGQAVGAGNVDGTGLGNYVVVGDYTVQVTGPDGLATVASPGPACPIISSALPEQGLYAYRSLAVGDFLTGGGDEIALGGLDGGIGAVVIMAYDGTTALQCPKVLRLGSSMRFGASLAAGDFDGDGFTDLAVGAPNDRVAVFLGPLDAVTDPAVTITSASTSGFGLRVAAYHLPGQATAQLLVSDPGANGGSGLVYLFNVSRATPALTTASAAATLFSANQETTNKFGSSLGGLPFSTGLCTPGGATQLVPWASNENDILTFFSYPSQAPVTDPRCLAQK